MAKNSSSSTSKRYLCMTNVGGGTLPHALYKGGVVEAEHLGDQATVNRLIKIDAIRETQLPLDILDQPNDKKAALVDQLGSFMHQHLEAPALDQPDEVPPSVSERAKAAAEAEAAGGMAGVSGTVNPAAR